MTDPGSHESISAHESTEALSTYLTAHGVEHRVIEHDETFTAASEARAAEVPAEQTAKTVVLEDRGTYLLALVPASDRLDLHKVRDLLGASKSLRLATENEIAEHFSQFEVGAVPPVGHVLFAGEVVDETLAGQPEVLCSGGDHRHSVVVDPRQIVRLAEARVADIREN